MCSWRREGGGREAETSGRWTGNTMFTIIIITNGNIHTCNTDGLHCSLVGCYSPMQSTVM